MEKWLSRFLIFLLIVIVCISIGLSIYYFMRNSEVFSLGTDEALTRYVNVGETFEVTVNRQNPTASDYSLISMDENVVKFVESYEDGNNSDNMVWRFEAISGGSTTIQLQTSNESYKNLNVAVYVGNGSVEFPFYIRDYLDLTTIGQDVVDGRTLSANYQQVADIDMSVATSACNPIGTGSTTGFTGTYNGNGHTISNLSILKSGSTYADENTQFVADTVENAGLFALVGTNGVVTKLNLSNVTIDGAFANAGAIAGVSNGRIEFVNVIDSVISNTTSTGSTYTGGVVGAVLASSNNTSSFVARVQYSGVSNTTVSGNAFVGGLVGGAQGGFIFNSFVNGNIASSSADAVIGGVVGQIANVENENNIYRNAVVNNYAVLNEINISANSDFGYVIGKNINYGAETNAILRPSSEDETLSSYNRILGNFYRATDGYTAISGQNDVMDAYLAFPVSEAVLKTAPSQEQIDGIISSGTVDANLAYVGYSVLGQFEGWNFNDLWTIDADTNNGYPIIRTNAIPVSDAIYDEFNQIIVSGEEALKRAFEADFADDGEYNNRYIIDTSIYLREVWTPIGSQLYPFNGQFIVVADSNGNMPVIYDMTVNSSSFETNRFASDSGDSAQLAAANREVYSGFFGYIGSNGLVQNLTIEGMDISTGQYVGTIAGYNAGTVIDCKVLSSAQTDYAGINLDKEATVYVGGIVGVNTGTMTGSSATLNITVAANTAYIGGVVGQNNGNIANVSYDGVVYNGNYSYNINVTNKTGTTKYVGGIAGDMTNGTISNSTFTGRINAPTSEGTIVGGIVGRYSGSIATTTPAVTKNSATNINITGYLAGGLVGQLNVTSSSGIVNNVEQSYSTGSIYGNRVGGLAGEISRGGVINCYSTANLSGSVMAGFAATIAYHNSGEYGRVSYCFSNVTFDNSAGKAYAETESEVYALNYFWDSSTKVGGYVEHCILNSASGGERHSSSYVWGPIDWDKPDDGWKSDSDCKNINTFTERGFDSSIWNFVSGQYPTLNMN